MSNSLAQKDLALYRKGDISTDEMRRKSQNSLYHTAFEDNLRLQAYSNPQFSLQQAEVHIAKFSIESLRDRSKEQVINPAEKTVNSPEKYGNAKEDLIRWDNQKITPLELGKNYNHRNTRQRLKMRCMNNTSLVLKVISDIALTARIKKSLRNLWLCELPE